MSVAVDASALVALVVVDERQGVVQTHLEDWLEAGEHLHAPAVLPYEIANVLARRTFDGDLNQDDVTEIWFDLAALGVLLHPFDWVHDGPRVGAVTAQLQRRHAIDSTYICLAQQLGTAVWTLDGRLARNASDVGLPVNLIS